MGSENSKSDNEGISQRNQTKKESRQRLYTEDEIQRALAYQKRMFEDKQLKMQTSSGIYPNLQTQNLNTISQPGTSTAVHYSVTPTAPLESVLFSPKYTNVSKEIYQQTSLAHPPTPSPRYAKPSGSTYGEPTVARPTHVTSSPSSAGPSHAAPSYAGPSSARPIKRNQKRNQAQQPRSSSRVNQNSRQSSGTVNCVTCNGQLSLHIYQCTNGHSSCDACRFKMARCGNCTEMITDMRNITLESTLADLTINTEGRIKCSNAKDGCCLHFSREQLQKHLKECPFNIISCPVMEFSGDCSWKGTIRQLATHFSDVHPKHREADVNKEMHIVVIELDFKVMHLVNIGFHQFLVQIRLDASLNNIYMVTQYLGTNVSASKWTYEWHVYNKKEPRRKFEYIDICKSNATPVSEIFKNNNCAVINLNYAKTFLDNGKLTFKFYIKKQFESKKNNNATTSN